MDPDFAQSGEPNKTPFNKAFDTNLPIFPWFELPENAYKLRRFGIAMEGAQNASPPGALLAGTPGRCIVIIDTI